jgi:hypothetical protein
MFKVTLLPEGRATIKNTVFSSLAVFYATIKSISLAKVTSVQSSFVKIAPKLIL